MGDSTSQHTSDTTSSTQPIKLALLLCDTPIPSVVSSIGTYLDIFREQLRLSYPSYITDLKTGSPLPFKLDGFDVVSAQEYPDLDKGGYRGVLISGSKYSAYDNDPWIGRLVEWVRDVAERRQDVKLIGAVLIYYLYMNIMLSTVPASGKAGICFGHQIVARALGGECIPNNGRWEVGTTNIELTDIGKKVFETDRSSLPIQQMHRDHVPAVPPNFHLLGSSPVAPVQGLVRFQPSSSPRPDSVNPKDIQILTVQGHPEFTSFIVNSIIDVREGIGAMSPEVVSEGRKRSTRPHEGTGVIGRAIWRVLGVDGKNEKSTA